MLCVNPYRTGKEEFGCGKCLPCLFTRRRIWVGRLMLELQDHRHSCFVTLTFKEVPDEFPGDHMGVFVRKLRRRGFRGRYFGVAEKGSRSGRPHYHMALFGMSAGDRNKLEKCWPHGFIHVGELNAASATYLVKYLVKDGAGFARMSLKPGIGGLRAKSRALVQKKWIEQGALEDVTPVVRIAKRLYPKGQYIRKLERVLGGMASTTPTVVLQRKREEYAAEDAALREERREQGYVRMQAQLSIIRSKDKL